MTQTNDDARTMIRHEIGEPETWEITQDGTRGVTVEKVGSPLMRLIVPPHWSDWSWNVSEDGRAVEFRRAEKWYNE